MLTVEIVYFRRNHFQDKEEKGVMINRDMLIIDMKCKPVPAPIWSWRSANEAMITIND